jgi:hypothetical protein
LEAGLAKARSDSAAGIASLEINVMSIKAHIVDSTAAGEKRLNDFEAELVRDLAGLRRLYIHNIQVIRGLCSLMFEADPSAADYIHWLSMEVVGLPEMFADVNENFVSNAVEGALVMAEDSVDLDAFQDVAAESRPDIFSHGSGCAEGCAHGIQKILVLLLTIIMCWLPFAQIFTR